MLSVARRVVLWDQVLHELRIYMRAEGLREVSTPTRVGAVAAEPHIEPIRAAPGLLTTSPELAMKRLLCHGGGPCFQVAHCFRAGERGDHHLEEFHMLEWYRDDPDLEVVMRDVEHLVERVQVRASSLGDGGDSPEPPKSWLRVGFLDVFEDTTNVALRGDEDAEQLSAKVAAVSADLGLALPDTDDARRVNVSDPQVRALDAWTQLWSAWSATRLPTWLAAHPDDGVHLTDYPPALAALAECEHDDRRGCEVARRFESYVDGLELANGYRELREAGEQRSRFDRVNALRDAMGQPPLPLDTEFLADLADPGLPPCAGVALGLDRLVMWAVAAPRLADIALVPAR